MFILVGAVAILYMIAMGFYVIGVGIALLLGFRPEKGDRL